MKSKYPLVVVYVFGVMYENPLPRGTWVAQLFKYLTLDFDSGHNLRVVRLSPTSGSSLGIGACLRFSLSLCPSRLMCALSLFYYFYFLKDFIYLRETQDTSRGSDRQRENQVLHRARSLMRDSIPGPWGHELS